MIKFTEKQWQKVKNNYKLWWQGKLGRPILPCVFWGAPPEREMPDIPLLSFKNCSDLSITPEQIIDRYDYELSCYEYYGDSFPLMQMMQFGPGVIAAFLGAELISEENTVWFNPGKIKDIKDIHFEYNKDNIWLKRVKDIYKAGMKKWEGNVVMGMVDLGGILDVLAVFRTTDKLLLDLYDEPEEVKRLIYELQHLWLRYYNEINEILKGSQGYSDWSSIFYEKPSYMLQSDFSYMISPEMFNEFVIDEISNTASRLNNAFYHLDGEGQLAHINYLLNCEHIKGIQWVPGEGYAKKKDWSELYSKIGTAGKKIQAYYNLEEYLDNILNILPQKDLLIKMQFGYSIERKEEIIKKLEKYGV